MPPESSRGRRPRRCAVDAVGVDCLRRRCFHGSAAHERRSAVLACRHAGHAVVLVDRELGQQAGAETVGRDGAQPPAAKGGHVPGPRDRRRRWRSGRWWAPAARSACRQAPAARCRRCPAIRRSRRRARRSRYRPRRCPRLRAHPNPRPGAAPRRVDGRGAPPPRSPPPPSSGPGSRHPDPPCRRRRAPSRPPRITVTLGGLRDVHAERFGNAFADGLLGSLAVEWSSRP